jgi:hypothetical protein
MASNNFVKPRFKYGDNEGKYDTFMAQYYLEHKLFDIPRGHKDEALNAFAAAFQKNFTTTASIVVM